MRSPRSENVVLSIFDRLTDGTVNISHDVPEHPHIRLGKFKASVARDLMDLLNTRRSNVEIPGKFERTRQSIVSFGTDDFTTAPMDHEDVRRAIERAIRLFEPRLTRVQVSANDAGPLQQFQFRISAILQVDWGQEPVYFDAELPKETPRFRVNPGR